MFGFGPKDKPAEPAPEAPAVPTVEQVAAVPLLDGDCGLQLTVRVPGGAGAADVAATGAVNELVTRLCNIATDPTAESEIATELAAQHVASDTPAQERQQRVKANVARLEAEIKDAEEKIVAQGRPPANIVWVDTLTAKIKGHREQIVEEQRDRRTARPAPTADECAKEAAALVAAVPAALANDLKLRECDHNVARLEREGSLLAARISRLDTADVGDRRERRTLHAEQKRLGEELRDSREDLTVAADVVCGPVKGKAFKAIGLIWSIHRRQADRRLAELRDTFALATVGRFVEAVAAAQSLATTSPGDLYRMAVTAEYIDHPLAPLPVIDLESVQKFPQELANWKKEQEEAKRKAKAAELAAA